MIQKNEKLEITQADIFMLQLIVSHWFIAAFITSYPYHTQILGFVVGGTITLATFLAYQFYAGTRFFRVVVAISLLSFSVLFIQQFYGRIEFHFHIFVALAFLTVYKDRVPLAVGSIFILLHHLLFNYLQQYNVDLFDMKIVVFNYGCGLDIVLVHAIFVLAEWLVIDILIKAKIKEYTLIVQSKDQLLLMNQTVNKERAKYKKLMSLAANGIILMDKNYNFLECSEIAAKMLGYKITEMEGLHITNWDKNITPKELMELSKKLNEIPISLKTIYTRKDGTTFDVEISIVEITIDREDLIYISLREISL